MELSGSIAFYLLRYGSGSHTDSSLQNHYDLLLCFVTEIRIP